MVDFNNEATIGTPALDITRVVILQRRYDVIDAIEKDNTKRYAGTEGIPWVVQARIKTLFIELEPMLKRHLDKAEYEEIKVKINKHNEDGWLEAFNIINTFLDKIQITKIDTRPNIDLSNPANEDKHYNL